MTLSSLSKHCLISCILLMVFCISEVVKMIMDKSKLEGRVMPEARGIKKWFSEELMLGVVFISTFLMMIGVLKRRILPMIPLYLTIFTIAPMIGYGLAFYAAFYDQYEMCIFGYMAFVYLMVGPFFAVAFEIHEERGKKRKLQNRI